MTTGPQKGHYNDANDDKNLLDGSPTAGNVTKNENEGDGVQSTPSLTANNTTTSTVTPSYTPSYEGYDKLISLMEDAQKSTQEDVEKAKRQERLARAHSFTGGIADLGRALANLYYTTDYAPNGYDHSKDSRSEKAKERADKWRAERQRLQKEYNNYAMQGANAMTGRERMRLEQQKAKLAQDKWETEEARKDALNKAKVDSYEAMTKYREAIAAKNYALAKKYEQDVLFLQAKEHYLGLGYNQKQAESAARVDANNALAEKRRAEAGGTTTTTTINRDALGNETGRTVTKQNNGGKSSGGKGTGYGSGGSNSTTGRGKGY